MSALIINADDLGVHPEIDRGIIEAYTNGILTSASLLVTTSPHWRDTARAAAKAGLPFGLHLCLTHGTAISPPRIVPDLVDADGRFNRSAIQILLWPSARERLHDQVRREFDAQITALREIGAMPTHLDSHQHVHMHPAIFAIVEDLAVRHQIAALRFVREPFFTFELRNGIVANLVRKNPVKTMLLQALSRRIKRRLPTNDRFFGVTYSGNLDKRSFLAFLHRISRREDIWEVGFHPGFPAPLGADATLSPELNRFIASPWRRRELDLALDPEVRLSIRERGIKLISFAQLPDQKEFLAAG